MFPTCITASRKTLVLVKNTTRVSLLCLLSKGPLFGLFANIG